MSLRPSPDIAKAGVIMMLSLLLSRVLGVIRDATMSGMFGANIETDAYRLAFQVPDLLFFLVAGGALSSAFIPVFSEYFHTGRQDEAWKVFSVVTSVMSIAVSGFILLAWIFAVPLAHAVAPGKPDEIFPLIAQMSRIVLPAQFAFFIGGLMFGTLYARQMFAVPGLGPNFYNIGIIFGALVLSWFCDPRVIGMSWGALIGAFIGSFLIPLYAMKKLGSRFAFDLNVRHPGVKKVFRLMLPVALGLSLPGVYGFIMMWFGSFYEAGVVTWLDYANRLMQAPLGIFGQSLAIAVFPALAQFYAEKRMDAYRASITSTLRTVLYITIPVSVLMFVLAPEIVTILYQHGHFKATDTVAVSGLLRYFCFGIAAWCLHPVLMRGYFALHHSLTPIVLGTITSAVFVGLVLLLKGTALGFGALPLASSIAAWLLAAFLIAGLRRHVGGLDVSGILETLAKSGGAALIVGMFAAAALPPLRANFHLETKLGALFGGGVIMLAASWAYYYLTVLMEMPEKDYVRRALKRMERTPEPDDIPPPPAI